MPRPVRSPSRRAELDERVSTLLKKILPRAPCSTYKQLSTAGVVSTAARGGNSYRRATRPKGTSCCGFREGRDPYVRQICAELHLGRGLRVSLRVRGAAQFAAALQHRVDDEFRRDPAGWGGGGANWCRCLVPYFWKNSLKEAPATFNARAQTVAEKPMFRDASSAGAASFRQAGSSRERTRRTASSRICSRSPTVR
jgi:hypothetical protein